MKIAFLFPGQGSQFVGMGEDIYQAYPEARLVFEEAGEALGQDIKELCFKGSEKELGLTINTQPAILTVSIAILKVLEKLPIHPDFVAGHSLGEYSALVAAKAISFSDAAKAVRARAQFMQTTLQEDRGSMAAILGWPKEQILELIKTLHFENQVFVANLNSPEQIVIAGEKEAVDLFIGKAQKSGAKRCVRLEVSVPSHCPLMKRAGELLRYHLESIRLKSPQIPVVNNVEARIITKKEEVLPSLVQQVSSPVLWHESMQLMLDKGIELFIEIGPGKVLSNLLRRIDRQAKALTTENVKSLQHVFTVAS